MRLIYLSKKGGKPLRMGMNYAKRVAHSADRRDQLAVQKQLGFGLPRQHGNHQQLVRQRHAYYADVYQEIQNERLRLDAQIAASADADAASAGDADRAVSEPEAGPDDQ